MWNIIFYTKEDGRTPVQEFLDQLPVKHRAKAMRDIDLLELHGTTLTEPHVKHIKGKMWELRIAFANDISRVFYFVHVGTDIVLLHGFVKKTLKTPTRKIEVAQTYMNDYQRRNT